MRKRWLAAGRRVAVDYGHDKLAADAKLHQWHSRCRSNGGKYWS
ncbi:hypothetical protein [Candidatus Accumulibacter sp. ACC012]|nr:hypothetical protein [Candidatus Accumulibacter sp. ACC012]